MYECQEKGVMLSIPTSGKWRNLDWLHVSARRGTSSSNLYQSYYHGVMIWMFQTKWTSSCPNTPLFVWVESKSIEMGMSSTPFPLDFLQSKSLFHDTTKGVCWWTLCLELVTLVGSKLSISGTFLRFPNRECPSQNRVHRSTNDHRVDEHPH